MKRLLQILIAIVVLLSAIHSFAGTYYVSPTGSAPWSGEGNCTAEGTPCSYSTANTSAVAGDTVVFKDGTYTAAGSIITPTNSGTAGNLITFQSQNQYGAVIKSTAAHTIALNAVSYITVDGFYVKRDGDYSWARFGTSGNHNTLQNCKFRTDDTGNTAIAGIGCYSNASYISILNNDILDGYASSPSPIDTIILRADAGDTIEYVLIQDNQIQGGAHSSVALMEMSASGVIQYVIIKGNNISNPNHRTVEIGENYEPEYIVIDDNVIRDAGEVCDDNSNLTECSENAFGSTSDKALARSLHNNLQFHARNSIVRKNRFYKGGKFLNSGWKPATSNRFYNNTIYKHGLGIYLNGSGAQTDNLWANNAFCDSDLTVEDGTTNRHVYYIDTTSPCANTWRHNNFDGAQGYIYSSCAGSWGTETFEELVTRTGWTDGNQAEASGFTNKAAYVFTLAVGSALIDAGDFLTTTNGTGSESYALVVNDSKYFTDGFGLVTGDTIEISGVGTAVVTDINYSTHTLTLDTALTWGNGVGVALSYEGTAPDIGAFESGATSGDTTNPVISNASPSETQACTTPPSRDVVISVTCTDDNACTSCKADTTETDIDSMTLTMTQSGQTWSYTLEGLSCGSSDAYQVECKDAAANESGPTTITVAIQASGYTPPASVVGVTAGTGTVAGGGIGKIDGQ